MKQIVALNKVIGNFLKQGGAKDVSQVAIKGNKEGTYRWAQSCVELSNGTKFMVKVYPIGPEAHNDT